MNVGKQLKLYDVAREGLNQQIKTPRRGVPHSLTIYFIKMF